MNEPQFSAMSREDERAFEIMERTIKKINRRCKLSLPRKNGTPNFPNNRSVAEKRLSGLKRKLLCDSEWHDKYSSKMQEYVDNGYASLIPNP